MVDLRYPSI